MGSEIAVIKKAYIYSLFDPRDQILRYVGQTKQSIKDRLYGHIWEAKNSNSNSYKNNWVRSLLKEGIEPHIRIIKEIQNWTWLCNNELLILEDWQFKNVIDTTETDYIRFCNERMNVTNYMKVLPTGKRYKRRIKNCPIKEKTILQYDLQGNFIKDWESISKAGKELKIQDCTISSAINNKRTVLKAGNFMWKRKVGDILHKIEPLRRTQIDKKPVLQYSLSGEFVKEWNSVREPEKEGFASSSISRVCRNITGYKNHKGYIWKFKEN